MARIRARFPLEASTLVELLKKNKSTIAAISLSIISFVTVWLQMTSNVFPPGDDPGNWLKRVNALAGTTYPLWDETVFTYPPLFFAVTYIISLLLGSRLAALKLVAALVFSSIPFATFLFARRATRSSAVGLATAWIMTFFPGQFEMLWWGAYPNLLAISIMSIALLTLLLAQEGSPRNLVLAVIFGSLVLFTHHLTSLVYLSTLTIVFLVSVAMREKRAAKANFLVLALEVLIFVGIWYASLSSYITRNPLISKPGTLTLSSLLSLFKDFNLLLLGLASAVLGVVQLLFLKRLREMVPVLAWLSSALLLTQLHLLGIVIDYNRFLYMMNIPLAILASASFLHLKDCVKISKGKEETYEVEVQVERAIPVIIVSILLVFTPFQGVVANQRAYDYFMRATGYSNEGRLQALDWIKQNTSENATIVSDFNFGRWVEGYGERRALFPHPAGLAFIRSEFIRYQAADAIMGSNYQLANKYLKLDEWQPVSTEFSPLVSTFQGARYVGLVYMSDSFNRINVTRDEKTWIEAPCNAWLYESRWLERSDKEARLQISLGTMGLMLEKELELQAEQTYANVTYRMTPRPDVALNTVSINVFLMWGRSLVDHEVKGNEVTLSTDVGEVKVKFLGEVLKLEVGKDPEYNQDRVYAEFRCEPRWAEVGVVFEVLAPQSSWIDGVQAACARDLEGDYYVTHVALPTESYYADRYGSELPEGEVVYIDDCYARVTFVKAGSQWVEVPYGVRVIDEKDGTTSYETIALYLNKTIVQHGPQVDVTYEIKGKEGVALKRFELLVWLCWERYVSDVSVEDGRVLLVTDAGALRIEPVGKVLNVSYGLDEEFHQPRVLIVYELDPDQDMASVAFVSTNEGSRLSVQLEKTARPLMEGSDRANINVTVSRHSEVFRNNEVVIFETPLPIG